MKPFRRALGLSLLFLVWSIPLSAQQLRIYHIDVEQASATLFVAPGGKTLLVDSGKNGMGQRIKTVMDRAHVKAIDFFVDTHYHEDHYGGIDDLIGLGVPVREAYDRGDKNLLPSDKLNEDTYQDYQAAVGNRAHQLVRGMTLPLDALMTVTCISAGGLVIGESPASVDNDENNLSISLLITLGTFRYFIGGDIQGPTEQKIANRDLAKDVDVYVADHHGSDTSSILPFIQDLSPHVIIVSNGDNAGFHHPRQSVLTSFTLLPGPPTVFQTNKCTKGPPCGNVPDDFIGDPQTTDQDGTIALTADTATHSYVVAFDSGVSRSFQFRSFPAPDPTPTLTSLSPASGVQGTILNVTLTGTGFASGLTLNAGSGITVGNIDVSSATAASATFSISSTADLGIQSVSVVASGGTSNGINFTVLPAPPAPPTLTSVTPAIGMPGSNVPVTLIGTGFVTGLTVNPGSGIEVNTINVISATTATAIFSVASTAGFGVRSITLSASGGTSNAATFSVHPQKTTRDFNFDGKADVLWRDAGGNVSMWLISGYAVMSDRVIANMWSGWSIAGVGDFNGDGKADILWHEVSGDVAIWLMDGTTIAGYGTIGNVWTGWSVAGTGDFNGDGKADIVWRDVDGNVAIWLMDGTTVAGYGSLGNVWTGWTIAGTGDFNGDGKADILWRDPAGNVVIWQMNGISILGYNPIGNIPVSSIVAGIADFDGDQKADILIRSSAGNVSLWLMNGYNIVSNASIGDIYTDWKIAGTGDYNGDGKADILWRDSAGNVAIWSMDGKNVLSFGAMGNVSNRMAQ